MKETLEEMRSGLRKVLMSKSVITGKVFTLASGKTSDFYVDARVSTLDPAGAYYCGHLLLDLMKDQAVDAVGGYAIGADPIVTAMALISHELGRPLPAFIIRKEEKTHGTRRAIEGNFPEKGRVILVDDVITSGGSILKGAAQVEAQGGSVAMILGVIDRQEGGRETIEAAGYPFRAIFTREELLGR